MQTEAEKTRVAKQYHDKQDKMSRQYKSIILETRRERYCGTF